MGMKKLSLLAVLLLLGGCALPRGGVVGDTLVVSLPIRVGRRGDGGRRTLLEVRGEVVVIQEGDLTGTPWKPTGGSLSLRGRW